jgi:Flp pilus assembly pilin Flp
LVPTLRCNRKLRCGLLKNSSEASSMVSYSWARVSKTASKTIWQGDNSGAIIVEYALILAIIVVGIATVCSPNGVVFQIIRALYARTVIIINMPWL